MPLDSDYTSATYNAYADLATVEGVISALDGVRDLSGWDALSDTQKENLIVASSRDLAEYCFEGELNPAVIAPNMLFPRSGLTYSNGIAVPSDEVPIGVVDYVAYRCLERQANPESSTGGQGQNVKRQKLGDLEQEFFNTIDGSAATSTAPEDQLSYAFLSPYLCESESYGANLIPLVRS